MPSSPPDRRLHIFDTTRLCIAALMIFSISAPSPAAVTALQQLAPLAPAIACKDLQQADVSERVGALTRVTQVTEILDPQTQPYCQAEGVIDPQITFELRLPMLRWTQRYLQTGCGGLCGTRRIRIEHASGCAPVDNGEIAVATTDMGHSGLGAEWAARDPGTKMDFGYRGVHLTALAARALIERFYGKAPRYSYFSGCSDGGREGLIEAQRFPEDFDGIAAGAPALNFTVQNSFYHAWNALTNTDADGHAILTADELPVLHAAVVEACDAADGLNDGLIQDPRRCNFDPAVIACKPGDASKQCLSAEEVAVVRKLYDGARDALGRRLVIGGPMPGSELAWSGVFVPQRSTARIFSATIAYNAVKYLYFDSPLPQQWSLRDLKFDAATLSSFKLRGLYDATDPDLSRFRRRGGKLIMWHGWSDPHISPLNSIAYFKSVQRQLGHEPTDLFARLFLFPGMYHCAGGEGPSTFDVLTPLMTWVESDEPPQEIIATQLVGSSQVERMSNAADAKRGRERTGSAHDSLRRRPVYPYPVAARYDGRGDPNDPASFSALVPRDEPVQPDWLGESFMTPGQALSCQRVGERLECAADTHIEE